MKKIFTGMTVFLFTGFFLPFFLFAQTSPSTSLDSIRDKPLNASTSTESLIAELQAQIKALQTRILELEVELGVKPEASAETKDTDESEKKIPLALPAFTTTLFLGSRGDDVRNLQTFLAQFSDLYPEGLITGYYGPLTEKAVQRWQAKEGIIASGSSETTGYGRIGPKTRARLNDLAVKPPSKKVIICHTPSDNLENKQTLEIAEPALKAHLAHGDYEGACDVVPPPSTATTTPATIATSTPATIATTTPTTTATTTPSGTISATPAQPIGQTGTTTVPATPAQTSGGTTPPPSSTPPPSTTDTTAPAISNVQATSVTGTGAIITWLTDEASDSQVEYSLTSTLSGNGSSTPLVSSLVTFHSVALTALYSNTIYHYRIKSKDAAGNFMAGVDYTFTTLAAPPPPTFDFSLSSSISGQSVDRGAFISFPIDVTRVPGNTGLEYVSFSGSNLPSGVAASFSSGVFPYFFSTNSCVPSLTPCSMSVTFTVAANASPGIYAMVVTGSGGGVTKNISFDVTINTAAILTDPIGHWKFDGNGTNEIAGGPNTVAVGNAVFKSSGGKIDGYGYIPSGSDYFKIPYNSVFDLPDTFTVELWFRQRSDRSFLQNLIYKGTPSNNYNFRIFRQLWNQDNFGPIIAGYTSSQTGYWTQTSNQNQLAHNVWHHVVYTKNSAMRAYYLDGILINSNLTNSPSAKTPANDIIIGDSAVDTDIDDVKIYNRLLSDSEVSQHFASVPLSGSSSSVLAFILQSLSAALDDIQKQIQKLAK